MVQRDLDELAQWKRDQLRKLMEVSELTEQLAQAVERRDQVSVRMVLSMRQEPIRQAAELDEYIRRYLLSLPQEDAARLNGLLEGGEPETEAEKPLASLAAQARRLLERIRAMDKATSVRLGGSRSFYRKFREPG